MSNRFPTQRIHPPFWNCCMVRPTRVIVDATGERVYACPGCAACAYGWGRAVSLLKPRTSAELVNDAARAIVAHVMDPTEPKLQAARVAVAWAGPFLRGDLTLSDEGFDLYVPPFSDEAAA